MMTIGTHRATDAATLLEILPAHVPAFRDGHLDALDATAERIDVHRGRIASVAFQLRTRDRDSGETTSRPAFLLPTRPRRFASRGPDPLGARDRLQGGAGPDSPWAVVSPADPVLADPLAVLDGDASRWSADLLGHRLGRRITFGISREHRASSPGIRLILKCTAGRTSRRASAFLRRLAPGPRSLRIPRLVFEDSARGVVVLEYLPGRSLHDAIAAGDAFPMQELGVALAALQARVPAGLPCYRPDDEVATIRKLAERAAVIVPDLPARIESALARIPAAPGRDPLVLCHRDLHDKQILADGDRISVIDWDSACLAPPALDIGNLLAHLRLRELQRCGPPGDAERRRSELLRGLAGAGAVPDPSSLRRWETLALIRLAAVYTLRPRWTHLGRELLDAALAWKEAA